MRPAKSRAKLQKLSALARAKDVTEATVVWTAARRAWDWKRVMGERRVDVRDVCKQVA